MQHTTTHHRWRLAAGLLTVVASLGVLATAQPATAQPSSAASVVKGSAYGYSLSVAAFNSTPYVRGVGQVPCTGTDTPPGCAPDPALSSSPSVVLPASGGNVSAPDPDGATARVGSNNILFTTGAMNVSSTGTVGTNPGVTSTASLSNIGIGNLQGDGEVFGASNATATCASSSGSTTGSTSVSNGVVIVDSGEDANGDGDRTDPGDHVQVNQAVPATPAPNLIVDGHFHFFGITESFRYIFNEQVVNPDGSITVSAAHKQFLGPIFIGDQWIGRVECGLNTSATAPAAPTGVTVTPSATSASVAFTPGADGGSPVTTFLAECTSTTGGATRTVSGAASPLVVSGLSAEQTYRCRVRATNAVGTSPYSAYSATFVPHTTAPASPSGVTASVTGPGTATVAFTPGPNGGSTVTSFTARCTSTTGGVTRTKTGPGSPLAVAGLTTGQTYSCQVRATNSVGNGPFSNPSATFVPGAVAPAAPTAVSVSVSEAGSANVSFTPGSDGGSPVTYLAQCTSTTGGAARSKTGASSPLTVSNLTSGQTYRCRVRATNAVGTSAYSAYSALFVP